MNGRIGVERGQSTVEFALVLPIVVVVLAGLLHVGFAIGTQLVLENAAREGARAAAVAPARADAVARSAAARAAGDRTIDVRTSVGPDHVTVTVSAAVPLVSFIPGLDARRLVADVTMRREDLP